MERVNPYNELMDLAWRAAQVANQTRDEANPDLHAIAVEMAGPVMLIEATPFAATAIREAQQRAAEKADATEQLLLRHQNYRSARYSAIQGFFRYYRTLVSNEHKSGAEEGDLSIMEEKLGNILTRLLHDTGGSQAKIFMAREGLTPGVKSTYPAIAEHLGKSVHIVRSRYDKINFFIKEQYGDTTFKTMFGEDALRQLQIDNLGETTDIYW